MRTDWFSPSPPPEEVETEPPLAKRLLWFAGLSLGGLVAVASFAYLLRGLLFCNLKTADYSTSYCQLHLHGIDDQRRVGTLFPGGQRHGL